MSGAVDGAIGGATSALLTPQVLSAMDPNVDPLTTAQTTTATAIAMLAGGAVAGLLGQNAAAGATWAENEAVNNTEKHWEEQQLREEMSKLRARAGLSNKEIIGYDADGNPITVMMLGPPGRPSNGANSAAQPVTAENFFGGTQYTSKVLNQAASGDYHGFPQSVDAFSGDGTVTSIVGGDGVTRLKLTIPGSYNGQTGVFEYIRNPDGTINHRLFVPNK